MEWKELIRLFEAINNTPIDEVIRRIEGGWVSVEDALPEAHENVFIRWGRDRYDRVKFCTVSDGDYFWDNMSNCVYQSSEVTHWQRIEAPHD